MIIESIRTPERDRRLEQIINRLGHTFDSAFEDPAVDLTSWLQNGKGLFWVSGEPGSGKSTFMKYISTMSVPPSCCTVGNQARN